MTRILGVEGGGTKTEWVVVNDAGETVASGVLPAANLRLIHPDALRQMLEVLPQDVTHVGVYLAGCAQSDAPALRALVQEIWPQAQVAVGSDRASGFAVCFEAADGITVIAGTGSAVTGRRGERIEKAGGWGQLLGDKGGGYNLAVQALRRVLSDYDLDQRVDELGQSILRQLALNRLEQLVHWATHADKMSVANLAPVVFAAAQHGHREMLAAVEGGAQTLAAFTAAVAGRLGLERPEVKLSGGLFVFHPEYGEHFTQCLHTRLPEATVSVCAKSGALGAAWLAQRTPPAPETASSVGVADLATAATEQRNPRSMQLDQLSTAELVDLFIREEAFVEQALGAVREPLVRAVELVSAALRDGGRLFYVGAGTSGRLGVLDASEIPPTFGASPELVQGIVAGGAPALHSAVEGIEDQPETGALAVVERGVRMGDVVCGIAASGRTPFVLGALRRAQALGAQTIFVTCNPSRSADDSLPLDVAIDLPTGPELITGSTRLKAGTATKAVLNLLSSCAMIRLGKVRENLMIDVSVSNAKLRDRAVRLVAELRPCPPSEARVLLEQTNWNVRAALAL